MQRAATAAAAQGQYSRAMQCKRESTAGENAASLIKQPGRAGAAVAGEDAAPTTLLPFSHAHYARALAKLTELTCMSSSICVPQMISAMSERAAIQTMRC